MNILERAIELVGGPSAFARAIGKVPQNLQHWRRIGKLPAEYCILAEQATAGAVTRYQLRPDVFGLATNQQTPKEGKRAIQGKTTKKSERAALPCKGEHQS